MKGYNRVVLMGNLTRDPELKYTGGGTAYLRFTLAVGYSKKQQDGGYKDDVDFPTCVVWGKRAEVIAQHFVKGSSILIEGKLRTGSYENKDGTKRYTTDVHVEDFNFVGGKKEGVSPRMSQSRNNNTYGDFDFRDGPDMSREPVEIPF